MKATHVSDEEVLHKAMAAAPTAESKLSTLLQGKKEYPGGVKYDVVEVKKSRQYAYQRIAAEKANK